MEYDWEGNKEFEGTYLKGVRKHRTVLFNFMSGESGHVKTIKELKKTTTLELKKGMEIVNIDKVGNNDEANKVRLSGNEIRGKSSEHLGARDSPITNKYK